MLRITKNYASPNLVVLLLEGQVINQWVDLAREVCTSLLAQNQQLILDVAGVTFADHKGIEFLRSLQPLQVVFEHCSPFLKEQLKQNA